MGSLKVVLAFLVILIASLTLIGCTPSPEEPCNFTTNTSITAYRLPDSTSDVFGTMSVGDTFAALARTVDGWLGFDPGVAQAGNTGLAHHRWVLMNINVSPSCLSTVELVTLADVEADM